MKGDKDRLGKPSEGLLARYRRMQRENGPEYRAYLAKPVSELPRQSLRGALAAAKKGAE